MGTDNASVMNKGDNTPLLQNGTFSSTNISQSAKVKWVIVITCFYINMLCGMTLAVQAPFFPKESDRKGIPASTYGFVFGVYDLVLLVASVPIGISIHLVGVKYCFLIGIFTLGCSTILFGSLSYIANKTVFITYAFLIRIVEALGASCINNVCLTVTSTIIPEKSSQLMAWSSTFFGAGAIVGPTVGGVLFDFDGFALPFIVIGTLSLLGMLPVVMCLPSQLHSSEVRSNNNNINWSVILKEGRMWCAVSVMALTAISSVGFLDVTLEPHLRTISSSGTSAGIAFLLYGLGYAGIMPLWGKLLDKQVSPARLMIVASFIMILGLAISGPFPWLPFQPQMHTIMIGAMVIGIGMGGIFCPAIKYIKSILLHLGYQDGHETAGVVSGIWLSSFSLGGFVGPSLSGILYDIFGYRIASLFMMAVDLVIIILLVAFEMKEAKESKGYIKSKQLSL